MYCSLRENVCSVRAALFVGHGNSNYGWAGSGKVGKEGVPAEKLSDVE